MIYICFIVKIRLDKSCVLNLSQNIRTTFLTFTHNRDIKVVNGRDMIKKTCILTMLILSGTVMWTVYEREVTVANLERSVAVLSSEANRIKKDNESIRLALLERTDNLMKCNNIYKKLKEGCMSMQTSCYKMMKKADHIITNRTNCRAVSTLQRCQR